MINHIAGPAGRLEALVDSPRVLSTTGETVPDAAGGTRPATSRPLRAAVVLAHPHPLHGGSMHTKVVFQAAKAFCRIGCAVLRFNFRGTGASEGRFDDGRGEKDDFRAALDFMAAACPGTELWAAGMSFGAWIAMTTGAGDARVTSLLGISAPVELYDFSSVGTSRKPKFFIHGERDELCSVRGIRRFYAHAAEPKDLIVIDAADHLFDGRVSEVAEAIEGLFE